MSRGVIIVLMIIGISGQLFKLCVFRGAGSELTTPQRIALWTKMLSLPLALLSGCLSLVVERAHTPLDVIFITSLGAWVVSTLWIRRVPTSTRLKSTSEFTWSPFYSTEVREICAHLTPTEHARLMEDARGVCDRLDCGSLSLWALLVGLFYWSWQLGLLLVVLFLVYFVLWVLPRFRAIRRHSIELLCETEWARTHSYAPTRLRLMKLPWSK